jgi:hypothetical protein
MLTPEESRLLSRLRTARGPLDERQLADFPTRVRDRLLADLEWQGLIVVLRAAGGTVAMLTPRGWERAAGRA